MTSLNIKSGGLEFKNVYRHFGEVVAVRDVSFVVDPGTLVTLLGPSGCGKTTTLRMIAGLEMASEGTILIGGRDVTRFPATDRDVTMVFQNYALFPHMSVQDNVAFGLEVSGIRREERLSRVREGLALVGLAGYESRMPSELSGGQQQRVAVARALVLEPEVLLFDEPLSNLDAKLRRRMRDDIRDLQQKLGLTSVYVTHDQEEALAVSDKIIVMNKSVIAQHGTPRQLYSQPASAFVADFMGMPNLIPVTVARQGDTMTFEFGGAVIRVKGGRDSPAGEAVLAVRPQAIRLSATQSPETLPVILRKATYLGSHVEYRLDSAVGELFAIGEPLDEPLPLAQTAFASFDPTGVALIPPDPVS